LMRLRLRPSIENDGYLTDLLRVISNSKDASIQYVIQRKEIGNYHPAVFANYRGPRCNERE
jgi:hypothetical protein